MSEDEMESFEITDYDLDNEFNTNRFRRKLSKKQQMLGKINSFSLNINIYLIHYLTILNKLFFE